MSVLFVSTCVLTWLGFMFCLYMFLDVLLRLEKFSWALLLVTIFQLCLALNYCLFVGPF